LPDEAADAAREEAGVERCVPRPREELLLYE
jgi:hypothetical protein